MDVPVDAATLVYGVFLAGMGRMDVDDVHFLPVPVGAMSTTVFEESQLKLKQGETYTPPSIVQDAPAKAGQRLFTLQTVPPRLPGLELAPNGAARAGGFSLHAGIDIQSAQREKLERLCRYISRPPVASERLALTAASGQVR